MITEKDLDEAIAQCNEVRNPNANTCVKLAAYYIIKDHLFGDADYSFDNQINGKDASRVMPIFEELLATIRVLNPHLYESVMRKLEEV